MISRRRSAALKEPMRVGAIWSLELPARPFKKEDDMRTDVVKKPRLARRGTNESSVSFGMHPSLLRSLQSKIRLAGETAWKRDRRMDVSRAPCLWYGYLIVGFCQR